MKMADTSSSFWTQANALLRKDLTFQKRNKKTNIRLILSPAFLCMLLVLLRYLVNKVGERHKNSCDDDISACTMPSPEQPPYLNIPGPKFRAVRSNSMPFNDLPDGSCRSSNRGLSCPVTMLFTGDNQTLGGILEKNMFSSPNSTSLDAHVLGSSDVDGRKGEIYYDIQHRCGNNSLEKELVCVESSLLWRNSSSDINKELYSGYQKGNKEGKINEIVAAYDFLDSGRRKFNMSIWYNLTRKDEKERGGVTQLSWIPRSVNLASNAFLEYLMGPDTKMVLEFVQDMPKPIPALLLNEVATLATSLVGPLFYTWIILQLFPVVLTQLVYEKQQRLRIMMKMHGLGDGPYRLITYGYFLCLSSAYVLCFVVCGSLFRLPAFSRNDHTIQAVFYFIYINLQIAVAFLLASFFSNPKTVTVLGYIYVFITGLLGIFLFQTFIEDIEFPRFWIIAMELYPGFSLYRGLYEFGQYRYGMRWSDLSDPENGMKEILIIMSVEWFLVTFLAYYFDQVLVSGKSPLFLFKKSSMPSGKPIVQRQGSKLSISMEEMPDVHREREKVEQLLLEPTLDYSIVCDDIKKIYPGSDGNPEKIAVRGLSLALPRGECFGMLGPNGAGKTSFISMMIGLTRPTAGTAYVEGLDIRTDMDCVHTAMGVCPQHDLLWETLTGREHLLFYGRLKNLKGSALTQAVEESLERLNLFNNGVADKQVGKYSGGMKRRLSVAISLIGDPKAVYMDEPSTGLDPASRDHLWNVVKQAKQDRAIILTTHSMEEAEALCDRLGIFVDGSLQCIGNPKELKARYGGSYVFTMTTLPDHEEEVERLVRRLSPGAQRVYHLSGTQKFELPKDEVKIADVFEAVGVAKGKFTVYAWGIVDTTLEDVFIKVARSAQAFNTLS